MPAGLLILLWRTAIETRPEELKRNANTLIPSRVFSSGLSQAFAFDFVKLVIASIIQSFWSNSVNLERRNYNLVYAFAGKFTSSSSWIIEKLSDSSLMTMLLDVDLSLLFIVFIEIEAAFDAILFIVAFSLSYQSGEGFDSDFLLKLDSLGSEFIESDD